MEEFARQTQAAPDEAAVAAFPGNRGGGMLLYVLRDAVVVHSPVESLRPAQRRVAGVEGNTDQDIAAAIGPVRAVVQIHKFIPAADVTEAKTAAQMPATRRATSMVRSFSRFPVIRLIAPGSFPPCPASMTTVRNPRGPGRLPRSLWPREPGSAQEFSRKTETNRSRYPVHRCYIS